MTTVNEIAYLPSKTSPLPAGPWLILAPHPDDETFGMGGTLLLAQAAGISADIIFFTNGDAGGSGEIDIVATRENEARQVAAKLGIRDVLFWREQDRALAPSQYLINRLSDEIKQRQPANLFFPSPQEPHPDHRATAVLAWESLRQCRFSSTPISYEISVQGYSNHLVDISKVNTKKQALMACYHSQMAENNYIERILGLNQARAWSLPLSVSHAEAFYVWPKQDRPINAMLLSIAAQQSSTQALPDALPLVSVITRTQNRPQMLREAIRSIAGQTYANIELVVVNDGGENCGELVKEEATGHIRQYHYEHLDTTQGRSHAANVGLSLTQGQFIIFLDDDDWFESHHLTTLVSELEQDKEAIAAYSSIQCVDESGNKIKLFSEEFDPVQLCIDNFMPIHAILFRRKAIAHGCLFDETLNWCEDWDFWLQVSRHGEFRFISEVGATYRMQRVGSGIWSDSQKTQQAMLMIYKKWLPNWDEKTLWRIFEYARHKRYMDQKSREFNKIVNEKNCELNDKDRKYNKIISEINCEFNKIINEKNRELNDKDHKFNNAITQKNQEIVHQNETLLQQSKDISESQQHIDRLTTEIDSIKHKAGALGQELEAVYASTSWKITKPIRTIKTLGLASKKTMRQFAYLLWSKLPLNVHQRIRIKAALVRQLPILNRLLGLAPISGAKVELPESPSVNSVEDTAQTSLYRDEYHIRMNAAVHSTPIEYVPLAGDSIDKSRTTVKVIAFYLPQFHPIPENNKEWGQGFTEWTNVSKAVPQFVGHYQPRLPGELGYYDLRIKEVQQRQIELAKQYGIDGFCYHHYWFGGKKVLEKPFQQILDDPSLDLPFCLCWANENWTRRWDGGDDEIILAQHHSPEDDIAFIKDIAPALKDKRYIRVNNKPLLIVYRPSLLPDPAATAARWRKYAQANGIGDLHIVSAATFGFEDFESINYDGLVQFPPHNIAASDITDKTILLNKKYQGHIFDFKEFSINAITALEGKQHTFPCVMTNWDNEARNPGKGHTFYGATQENYKSWLTKSFDFVKKNNEIAEQIVFINAWNEWAEGTYLEPDRRYGYAYLHATANVIRDHYNAPDLENIVKHNNNFIKTSNTAIIIHLYYPDLADDLLSYIDASNQVDYFINFPTHIDASVINKFCFSDRNTYITISPNKGRDILPFIAALDQVTTLGYDYLLKVHSKKTMYRKDGAAIRKNLFNELLGKLSIPVIIQRFEENKKLGLIAPTDSIVSLSNNSSQDNNAYLKNNIKHVTELLKRSGNALAAPEFEFVAGSMFWARVQAVRPILDLDLTSDDFEEELGQTDGTMAHAVERIFSFIASKEGYKTVTLDSLCK